MIAENDAESEFQRWASEQLEVPRDATPEAVKGAFLRRLSADRFCTPASIRQAYDGLRGTDADDAAAISPWDDAWLEVMGRVRAEVERFAGEFFQLPPAARQTRWEQLQQAAAPFPRIVARLAKLQGGLTTELREHPDAAPLVARLARACCALFVLRPSEQAVLRQSLEAEFADDPSKWALTAKILRAQSPEIVALAPYLVEWLLIYTERGEQTARAHRRAVSARAANWEIQPARLTRAPHDPSSIWRVVVIGMVLSGALSRFNSSETPSRPSINLSLPIKPAFEPPEQPSKPTGEPMDTSLIPPKLPTQTVELRDEHEFKQQREIERHALELIQDMLGQPREKPDRNQEQPPRKPDGRTVDEPAASIDPP